MCGLKVKTAHKSATPEEMKMLSDELAGHLYDHIVNAQVASAGGGTENASTSEVKFTLHGVTPATGFENAEVVGETKS